MFDTPAATAELAANRTSQFSDQQRKRLRNNLWGLGCGTAGFLALLALLFIFVVAELLSADLTQFDSDLWFTAACLGAVGLGLLGLAGWFGWRLALTWQDVSEARIEQGDGEVAWRGSNYRAEIQSRKLTTTDVSLAPGPYRFYYLPRTGRVLSAEKLALGAGGSADDALRTALAQALKFRLEGLADWRNGRLGEAGAALLRSAWISAGVMVLALGGFLAVFVFAILEDNSNESWVALLPSAIVGAVILAMVWGAVNVTRDVMDDRVVSIRGRVRRLVRRSSKSTTYYYVLDKLQFVVSGAAYNALIEGREYQMYYLPRAKKLIGIEPVE